MSHPKLDEVLPRYDQRERHHTWIAAPPRLVWQALHSLKVRDLPLTNGLARLRGGPRAWLAGTADDAALDQQALNAVAPRELLADPPHELVLGDIARYSALAPGRPDIPRGDLAVFTAFTEPGWSKVAMNFRFTGERDGTRLSTETRVFGTDDTARAAFRPYWLLVRVGSGLVRHDILRAVRARSLELTAGGRTHEPTGTPGRRR